MDCVVSWSLCLTRNRALWIVKAEFEIVGFETPRGQVDVALLVTATIASNTVA